MQSATRFERRALVAIVLAEQPIGKASCRHGATRADGCPKYGSKQTRPAAIPCAVLPRFTTAVTEAITLVAAAQGYAVPGTGRSAGVSASRTMLITTRTAEPPRNPEC